MRGIDWDTLCTISGSVDGLAKSVSELSDNGGGAHRHALHIISFKILMFSPNSPICKKLHKEMLCGCAVVVLCMLYIITSHLRHF